MNITKKSLNTPQKKSPLADLYRLQRGCYNFHSQQNLPKYSDLYANTLSPRQKSIIDIILYIELSGSKGFFDAKTEWIVQHIRKVGHRMTKNILDKDLRYLESLGLIYRNTWSIPKKSGGGRKRKHTFIQINSQLILKLSLGNNIALLAKDPEKQVILKDLTVRSGKDVQD